MGKLRLCRVCDKLRDESWSTAVNSHGWPIIDMKSDQKYEYICLTCCYYNGWEYAGHEAVDILREECLDHTMTGNSVGYVHPEFHSLVLEWMDSPALREIDLRDYLNMVVPK